MFRLRKTSVIRKKGNKLYVSKAKGLVITMPILECMHYLKVCLE